MITPTSFSAIPPNITSAAAIRIAAINIALDIATPEDALSRYEAHASNSCPKAERVAMLLQSGLLCAKGQNMSC